MVTLTCQRCDHGWDYGGESQYYATCPTCKSSVKVEDSSSNPSSEHSSPSESTDASDSDTDARTVELATGDMVREMEVVEAIEELHETTISLGAAQESLRQRVDGNADQLEEHGEEIEERSEEIEEVAGMLKELIEAMGGGCEYETVNTDSGGETGMSAVAEVAKEVEVDG